MPPQARPGKQPGHGGLQGQQQPGLGCGERQQRDRRRGRVADALPRADHVDREGTPGQQPGQQGRSAGGHRGRTPPPARQRAVLPGEAPLVHRAPREQAVGVAAPATRITRPAALAGLSHSGSQMRQMTHLRRHRGGACASSSHPRRLAEVGSSALVSEAKNPEGPGPGHPPYARLMTCEFFLESYDINGVIELGTTASSSTGSRYSGSFGAYGHPSRLAVAAGSLAEVTGRAIRASISIPGAIMLAAVNGCLLVDGAPECSTQYPWPRLRPAAPSRAVPRWSRRWQDLRPWTAIVPRQTVTKLACGYWCATRSVTAAEEITRGLRQFPVPGPRARLLPKSCLPGPVHRLKTGSDPVGRLPVAMPSTISAADHLRAPSAPLMTAARSLTCCWCWPPWNAMPAQAAPLWSLELCCEM